MAITTEDLLLSALGNNSKAQSFGWTKSSLTTSGNVWNSLWRTGSVPAAPSIPTTAAILTNSTAGSVAPFTNPSGGEKTYVAVASAYNGNGGADYVHCDRLAHMGGLSGTVTTAQTVSVDVTGTTSNINNRRGKTDYSEVTWWFEVYTAIGATPTTATVSYTNGAGTSGLTSPSITIGASLPAGRLVQILGIGGEAIQSIQTITLAASTGTAGNFGITARRPLFTVSTGGANAATKSDWAMLGFPAIEDSACIEVIMVSTGASSTGAGACNLKLVQG